MNAIPQPFAEELKNAIEARKATVINKLISWQ